MDPASIPSREQALLSLVLPVYDEEDVLPRLYQRLLEAAPAWGVAWEAIFVDDGSRDGSLELLRRLSREDPRVRVVALARNFGHQAALSAGLQHARGDAVVVLDADLQDPPEVVGELLERWRQGFQIVYGVRTRRKEGLVKRTLYAGFYRLMRALTDFDLPLDSGDFCLMDRRVVDAINSLPERNRFVRGLRAWVGFAQVGVRYERAARAAGTTKYPFVKLVTLALDGIINFSVRPLSWIALLGVATSLLSFLGLVFFALHRFIGFKVFGYAPQDVPGFTSIIFSILFIGGMQLFALGLIGEYVGRILSEVKRRPLYIARELIGFPPAEEPGER